MKILSVSHKIKGRFNIYWLGRFLWVKFLSKPIVYYLPKIERIPTVYSVVIDYEDPTPTLYGKNIKDTLQTLDSLKKASNYSDFERVIKKL